MRSGQVDAPPGHDHWILKFAAVADLPAHAATAGVTNAQTTAIARTHRRL